VAELRVNELRRIAAPIRADIVLPIRMLSFDIDKCAGSMNARCATKRAIVKPIPQRIETPYI
jgi:hypothetical protein